MNRMPGFNAVASLSKPTQSYCARTSGISSTISSVTPQTFGALHGFGRAQQLSLPPLPPPGGCAICNLFCYLCRFGLCCEWQCQSIPCYIN
jgi:hypothetical protein